MTAFCPPGPPVALRKESVDRNPENLTMKQAYSVALRKESVDRNISREMSLMRPYASLSARRAWIEILIFNFCRLHYNVSLSARRAWIEIILCCDSIDEHLGRSPQGERG